MGGRQPVRELSSSHASQLKVSVGNLAMVYHPGGKFDCTIREITTVGSDERARRAPSLARQTWYDSERPGDNPLVSVHGYDWVVSTERIVDGSAAWRLGFIERAKRPHHCAA